MALAFASDNRRFAAGCISTSGGQVSSRIYLMDLDADQPTAVYTADPGSLVLHLYWQGGGQVLAVLSDCAVLINASDGQEVVYYTALQGGETVGYVFTVSTTGKSAGLTVMTGISADGKITGVTVTDDNETAGYVDKVRDGGLFDRFMGQEAPDGGFTLGKDIDGVSQATKTSRGVTDGVNQAVAYYQQIQKGAE